MRFIKKYKGSGWFNESLRHSLAAKGIKTWRRGSFAVVPNFDPRSRIERDSKQEPREESRKFPVGGKVVIVKTGREPGPPAPEAIRRREIEMKKVTAEIVRQPFLNLLETVRSGDIDAVMTKITDPDAEPIATSESERIALRDAVYEGIISRIQKNREVDWGSLKLLTEKGILSKVDVKQLKAVEKSRKRELRPGFLQYLTRKGVEAEERAEVGLKEAAGLGEKAVKGLKKEFDWFLHAGETAGQRKSRLSREAEEIEKEEELRGIFDPFKIATRHAKIDILKKKKEEEAKEKAYGVALRAERESLGMFKNMNRLAKIDLSAYDRGEKAFAKGDREALIQAITDLEAENMKLKDRLHMLAEVNALVISDKNIDQTFHMLSKQKSILPNALFGSGPGQRLAEQTKRISKVADAIKKSSNKIVARIGILRHRLNELDQEAIVPPPKGRPHVKEIKVVKQSGGVNLLGPLEEAEGKLRHKNPVIEGIKTKTIENPVLGGV